MARKASRMGVSLSSQASGRRPSMLIITTCSISPESLAISGISILRAGGVSGVDAPVGVGVSVGVGVGVGVAEGEGRVGVGWGICVGLGVKIEGEGVVERGVVWAEEGGTEGGVVNCSALLQPVRASMTNRLPQAALLKALVIPLTLKKVNFSSCFLLGMINLSQTSIRFDRSGSSHHS